MLAARADHGGPSDHPMLGPILDDRGVRTGSSRPGKPATRWASARRSSSAFAIAIRRRVASVSTASVATIGPIAAWKRSNASMRRTHLVVGATSREEQHCSTEDHVNTTNTQSGGHGRDLTGMARGGPWRPRRRTTRHRRASGGSRGDRRERSRGRRTGASRSSDGRRQTCMRTPDDTRRSTMRRLASLATACSHDGHRKQ